MRFSFSLLLLLAGFSLAAQFGGGIDPISWSFDSRHLEGNRFELIATATADEGWNIYSQYTDEGGPIPTTFLWEEGDHYELIGDTGEAGHLKEGFDELFQVNVAKFISDEPVVFRQEVRVLDYDTPLAGEVEYMSCDDEQCLPPMAEPFSFVLSRPPPASLDEESSSAESPGAQRQGSADESVTAAVPHSSDEPASGRDSADEDEPLLASRDSADEYTLPTITTTPVGTCSAGTTDTRGQSLWAIFGLGLLGGLFALIMPCIFPMIPLTVSFFTKSGGSRGEGIRRAGLYGFFIFLIYVLLSLPFHLLDGLDPGILNGIASNVWLNLLFFAVFMVFAGSFFGFYELTLPQSWSNRASRAEGVGGTLGIFFMALTLALVSFSCTGPILGSLLVEAVSDGAWPLTAGMAGFGVALGLPFALFAAFPGLLNNLPQSGGWLNSVKVVLGFVEVALAFKFLSNADLVGDWGLLRIEPFLLIWMLCTLGIAAYLFGLISFPNDGLASSGVGGGRRKPGAVGLGVGIIALAMTAYLGYGFTENERTGGYEPLGLLSGIAPPTGYSFFRENDCPQGTTCFKDLDEGLAYAEEIGKPVMLDFTGYTCVNCRKMEEHVWSEEPVNKLLTEDYVLVSLYVDDRSELPGGQQETVARLDGSGRTYTIDQVGEKWHYLQQTVFGRATQPYYALLSPDGQLLNEPVAYTPDVEDYAQFLRCGLDTYRDLRAK